MSLSIAGLSKPCAAAGFFTAVKESGGGPLCAAWPFEKVAVADWPEPEETGRKWGERQLFSGRKCNDYGSRDSHSKDESTSRLSCANYVVEEPIRW